MSFNPEIPGLLPLQNWPFNEPMTWELLRDNDQKDRIITLFCATRLPQSQIKDVIARSLDNFLLLEPILMLGFGENITDCSTIDFLVNSVGVDVFTKFCEQYPSPQITDFIEKSLKNRMLNPEDRNPVADQMIAELEELLSIYDLQFKDKKIAGLLYGSLLYGDPSRKPDYDFNFVLDSEADQDPKLFDAIGEMQDDLEQRGYSSHMLILDLQQSIKLVEQASKNNLASLEELDPSFPILTGKVIDLPEAKTHEIQEGISQYREALVQAADRNPLLKSIICQQLEMITTDKLFSSKPRDIYKK